jgi:VWFA-related protein
VAVDSFRKPDRSAPIMSALQRGLGFLPRLAVVVLTLVPSFLSPVALAQIDSSAVQPPKPARRLNLPPSGYLEMAANVRLSEQSNMSLDFLDSDDLLLTFNPKKLFVRLPECPPTHSDHLEHAVVFRVSTGKVVKEADWYLHDHRSYLWPLGSGRMLLRKLNNLYAVDSELHEKLLYSSPSDLLWVSVTPDGKQIIVETADQAPKHEAEAPAKTRVTIGFLDVDSLQIVRAVKVGQSVNLEGTSAGFVSTSKSTGDVWLIQFGPVASARRDIARVRSRRIPDILYSSNNTLLVGREARSGLHYSVGAFTLTGNFLWRQQWPRNWYSPTIKRSEDGSRFAVSGISIVDSKTPAVPNDDEDAGGREQNIGVFDAASGDRLLAAHATPVVLNGQNFSLSPDGRHLAVVQGSGIEIYDLPAMSREELAKYTAVKADVPGLYIPPDATKQQAVQESDFTADNHDAGAGLEAPAVSPKSGNPAQPATSPSETTANDDLPTFKTGTQVVALDVVVTDSQGHTVKNIPRSDFVVKEDAKPQNLRDFSEVSKTGAVPTPVPPPPLVTEAKGPPLPPNIFDNHAPSTEDSEVTVILYDELNTPLPDQQRTKTELLKFLANKPKGARFALCVLSESLRMVQGFTPDEALLAKAVKMNKGSWAYSTMLSENEQDQQAIGWLQQSASGVSQQGNGASQQQGAGAAAQGMLFTAGILQQQATDRRAYDLEKRIWLTMDAFTQMARYLSALPGRKSLIWLSGSFPLGIFPGIDFENPYSSNNSYMGQVKETANLLAESHVALYPVDVKGLTSVATTSDLWGGQSGSPLSAAPSPSQLSSAPGGQGGLGAQQQQFDALANLSAPGGIGANMPGGGSTFMDQASEHGIMDQLASDTGGKAFYNSNGISQAMTTVMDQEANYYSMAYTPTNRKYDGKFRKIHIALASSDKKLHLSYRTGYFAVDPDAPDNLSRDAVKGFGLAAMQHGSPQSHQLLFKARVVPVGKPRMVDSPATVATAKTKKKKKDAPPDALPPGPVEMQRYALDYAVTPSQLRFNVTPEGVRHGVFNFMVTSFDSDGALRSSIVSQATTDLKQDGYKEILTGGLRLHQEIDVPVKSASLRLGVQDALSGHMGTIETALPIKAPPGVEQAATHHLPEIEPD